ncbi:hypothetical protein Nmel_007340, partial [Mimus melanotis]
MHFYLGEWFYKNMIRSCQESLSETEGWSVKIIYIWSR